MSKAGRNSKPGNDGRQLDAIFFQYFRQCIQSRTALRDSVQEVKAFGLLQDGICIPSVVSVEAEVLSS
jgi:hypothetical protein